MGCKVILTPQSIDDLKEAVVTFAARHNPDRARTIEIATATGGRVSLLLQGK